MRNGSTEHKKIVVVYLKKDPGIPTPDFIGSFIVYVQKHTLILPKFYNPNCR